MLTLVLSSLAAAWAAGIALALSLCKAAATADRQNARMSPLRAVSNR
jgi:hypothetical protein